MQSKIYLSRRIKASIITCRILRRCRHTKGYQAMGSFHSEDVDVLACQDESIYKPPALPFDDDDDDDNVSSRLRRYEREGDFLLDPKFTFLNHGAFGAALRVGYNRAEQWRYHLERQPLRYFDRDLLPHLVYSTRQLADFCDASREALTLIPNVTYGLNTVIRGYVQNYKKSQHNIIIWDTSYGSLKKMAAEYCNNVTEIPVSSYFERIHEFDDPSEIFELALSNEIASKGLETDNALLVLDHTTSNTAINMPLHSLANFAKQQNMLVMVDGAHGLLANNLSLDTLPIDFYLGNGHKWLSCPRGIGFLYCPSQELRDTVLRHPACISHGIGQGYQSRFLWDGCRDYAAALSVPTVLDFWRSKNVCSVQEEIKNKLHQAVALMGKGWHGHDDSDAVTLVPLSLHSNTMALVRLPDSFQKASATSEDAKRIQDLLYDHYIEVPIKCINNTLYVRVSCHIYNTLEEYEKLTETILQWSSN